MTEGKVEIEGLFPGWLVVNSGSWLYIGLHVGFAIPHVVY